MVIIGVKMVIMWLAKRGLNEFEIW